MQHRTPTMAFFGAPVPGAFDLAVAKFRDCPWPHFDGVPDPEPNRILMSDLALTVVMNSGLQARLMWKVLERAETARVVALLTAIRPDLRLEDTAEARDPVPWRAVDALFNRVQGEAVALARAAKLLCRKRRFLIPMLDRVVCRHLRRVARRWSSNDSRSPGWFAVVWQTWPEKWDVPSRYIRMIRGDMLDQLSALRRLRRHLTEVRGTEVPRDASLVRLYEATLWKALVEKVLT